MTIVGIDVSSKQVNLAWVDEHGQPQRWHQVLRGPHLIDRLRQIHIQWPDSPSEVCIEHAFTRNRAASSALMATIGVITHQAPSYARVSWVSTGDLRTAIGSKNTKEAAHTTIHSTPLGDWHRALYDWSPDDLDALVACLGWAAILAAQDATE